MLGKQNPSTDHIEEPDLFGSDNVILRGKNVRRSIILSLSFHVRLLQGDRITIELNEIESRSGSILHEISGLKDSVKISK